MHHIPRLMILGSYAMQRGWSPAQVTDWLHRAFVDGYDWVMVPNVVGMSQHADGGVMATKPYTSGGAYLDRMTDHCGPCRFNPKVRVGEDACPFTAGYWWFLDRNRNRCRTTRGCGGLCRGWTGCATSPSSSYRNSTGATGPRERFVWPAGLGASKGSLGLMQWLRRLHQRRAEHVRRCTDDRGQDVPPLTPGG